jgi:hypothetical protein
MKSLLILISLLPLNALANDYTARNHPCVDPAVEAVVLKNYQTFGTSVDSCGIKPLYRSSQSDTYLVCTSNENEDIEYIVTVEKDMCETSTIGIATRGEAPGFETDEGLIIDAIECQISSHDHVLRCE